MSKFYLTTAIPYVNAKPHVGHAFEFIEADAIARYHRLKGEETALLSGGDENALKNVQAAEKEHLPIQEFIDMNSQLFADLAKALHVQFDVFQKGSNPEHHAASQALWERCMKNGDIYKKRYTGLYCVGCEMFYENSELNATGECFEHPGKKLDEVSEENYFFALSKYEKQLIDLIESDTLLITPESRKNEALAFIKQGLADISISRSNARAKNWGVPVPDDETQRMYVWFDALNIYQSGIGFGSDEKQYKKWWPADLHVIGKGILRFHAVYWPAFLLSAGLSLPKSILVHGYFTINGQKMSKTLGNVIDPIYLIEKYGAEVLRYHLLREIRFGEDGDFSETRLQERYTSELANGIGNLTARVLSMVEKYSDGRVTSPSPRSSHIEGEEVNGNSPPSMGGVRGGWSTYHSHMNRYELDRALDTVWQVIAQCDKYIDETQPWKLAKSSPESIPAVLYTLAESLRHIAWMLIPFMPDTAQKVFVQLGVPDETSRRTYEQAKEWGGLKTGTKINRVESLFPR